MAAAVDLQSLLVLYYVAQLLEPLLFGVYCVCFASSVWVLRRRRQSIVAEPPRARIFGRVISGLSWFIFVTLTIHLVCNMYWRYDALIVHGEQPLTAVFSLINSSGVPGLIAMCTYGFSAIAIDIILIYRVYIVWQRSWVAIALPAALTLFNCAGFIVILQVDATSGILGDGTAPVRTWMSVVFTLDAVCNALCSGLLIWKIVRNSNVIAPINSRGSLMPVLVVIAESAIMYTVLTLATVGGIISEHPWVAVMVDVLPPVAGITSCLLTVRIGLGMAVNSQPSTLPRSIVRSHGMSFVRPDLSEPEDLSVHIDITRSDDEATGHADESFKAENIPLERKHRNSASTVVNPC